jgi:hypothetical protein
MRTFRRLLNPVSTSATRLWCHSALRRRLLGLSSGQRQNVAGQRGRRDFKAVDGHLRPLQLSQNLQTVPGSRCASTGANRPAG